jgi:bifunctional UDP-N-acetylglucosamine pyrophosphorylase/glucosamine-1-phosphate N-acetyltransferase
MDAIILAAGLGTRLRPHTLTTPKPLLPVQGRPLLDWTLGALPPSVDRILVVVNYLAEQIEDYLRRQTHVAAWEAVRQAVPRGTGDAARACRGLLRSDSVLVLNGDDLYGAADLARLAQCPAGLLVHPVNDPRRWGIAFVKPEGSLDRLEEKPDIEGRHLANTGAYVFPRTVFDTELPLSARGEYEITDYVTRLARQQRVDVVSTNFWLPIGTVETWQAAQGMDLRQVASSQ